MRWHRWAGRARYGAMLFVAGLVVVAACSGGVGSQGQSHGSRDTAVLTTRHPAAASTGSQSSAMGAVSAPAGPAGPAVVPAASGTSGTPPRAAAVPTPAPTADLVTIAKVSDASYALHDDHPCSDTSSQSLARGEFEARRTGSTDAPLTVHYSVGGATTDVSALSGEVTIPAGAATASILVMPSNAVPGPPVHIHRSSTVTLTVLDGSDYDVGPATAASIDIHFDVDVFGCPAPPPTDGGTGEPLES